MQEFKLTDAELFHAMKKDADVAMEQARVSELKNEEAVLEAKEWAHIKHKAEEERKTAKECMEMAEMEMVRLISCWFSFVC